MADQAEMAHVAVIGVDLGGTKLTAGLVKDGIIVTTTNIVLPHAKLENDAQAIVELVITAIKAVYTSEVKAIGVGVPSVVDRVNGVVYDVHNIPSWKEVPLKAILEAEFKVPVTIDNDVNCFTIGEKFYGKGRNYENFVGLALGTGIGGGIVTNNRLMSDNNCGSGEFGEMYYLDSIIENYCSGMFFKYKHHTSGKTLYAQAEIGDKKALQIFNEFGCHLGRAIKMIMCAVDPEAIIIGGSVAKARKYFEAAMRKEISTFFFSRSAARLQIEFSELKHSHILGAAAVCLAN